MMKFMVLLLGAALIESVPMTLHKLAQPGAVCLDGTPAGFYFSAAQSDADKHNWQIYFQGGGWCYSEGDCWGRSKTTLGSSTAWPATASIGGLMSDNCSVNPTFCNYNKVQLAYCDGNSFSGNRADAVVYNGDKLYFRGRPILDAVIQTLISQFGLDSAQQVMLTGCSAGGLSTYLHADYVASLMPATVTRFKAASISGFFQLHTTVEDKPVYPDEMQYIFNLANSTSGVNQGCIDNTPDDYKWMCNFAIGSYSFTNTPVFVLDSIYDSWQTGCIMTSEYVTANSTQNGACAAAPGWGDCSNNPDKCTNDQMGPLNSYGKDFLTAIQNSPTALKPGNGGFLYSCHTHCAAQGDGAYAGFTIGGVTMRQAVATWWNSATTAPASPNWHWPCLYNTDALPRECNPSCSSGLW